MNTELVTTPHKVEATPRFWTNEAVRELAPKEICALFACWSLTDEKRIVWLEPSNLRATMWLEDNATNNEIKVTTDTLLDKGFGAG